MRRVFLRIPGSKRVVVIALAMLLLASVGSARAEFDPAYSGDQPAAEPAITEATPTADPSASPTGEVVPGAGGGGNVNNEVVVINTVDQRSAHRAGFGVARVTGDEAHNQNAAAATSKCNGCRTVAVAAQAVLIQRTDASTIAPRNYAIALNVGCVQCETFAAAYQYVFTTDGLVRFTDEAQQKLTGLQGQIRAVAGDEDLSFPEMEAKLDALVEQMWGIVRSELESVGVQGTGRSSKDRDEKKTGGESPTPSPSASETPTPSPSSSDTPGATDPTAEAPSPSTSPSEESTATPSASPT